MDLLAAVPSVVYGLWGLAFLNQHLKHTNKGLHESFGWFPLFGDTGGQYSKSILLACAGARHHGAADHRGPHP